MARPIVFGVLLDDADERWPGRNQLMLALAEFTPVVLLERQRAVGSRQLPRRPRLEQLDVNVFVMRDAFSIRSHPRGRRLGRLGAVVDGYWFHRCLRAQGLLPYIYWLTVVDRAMAWGVATDGLVFDCMDPNFLPARQREFDRAEAWLARRARMTFSTAKVLHDRMLAVNPRSVRLPNAACIANHGSVARSGSVPDELLGRSGPFVGYMGTIDWRFDAEVVRVAAELMPELTFVLVGRINHDQRAKVQAVLGLPNVVATGQVGFEEGLALSAAFDVAIIPFTPGPMNDSINPVKMYMHLINGTPVVSTWIAECVANDLVLSARDAHEFVQMIRQAMSDRGEVSTQRRVEFGLANTWSERARRALTVMEECGLYP
jgi:hypothetical protein